MDNQDSLKEDAVFTTTQNQSVHWKNRLIILLLLLFFIPVATYAINFIENKYVVKKEIKFSLVESSPKDNDQNTSLIYQPTLVFSQKLNILEKDISKYISISPLPQGNWHLEKNNQVIRFITNGKKADGFPNVLAEDTVYTITINKNLSSVSGKTLEKDETVQFRTQRNKNFVTSVEKKLVVSYPGKNIDVNLSQPTYGDQPNSLVLTLYSATKDQLISYFVHKENQYPFFIFNKTENNKQIIQYADLTKPPLRLTKNNYHTNISIPALTPGIYYANLSNPDGYEDFFIVVSNHIAVAFPQEKNVSLWTTDPSGQVLPNVKAELYTITDKANLLGQITTDNNGLATVDKKDNLDFIVTDYNDTVGVTQIGDLRYSIFSRGGATTSENLNAYSYSDRSVYRPGDTIHYKAIVRKSDNGAYTIPKGKLYVALESDFYSKKDYKELTIDNNGTVNTDITLPLLKDSTYTSLILATKNGKDFNTFNTLYIAVSSYRKPDFEFSVQTQEKEYVSADTGHATILAKTTYGEPLANTQISYRVITNDTNEVKDRSLEYIERSSYGKGQDLGSGTIITDQKGKAEVSFSTNLKDLEQSQIATIEVTPNIAATPSTATTQKLIHRGLFALFFDNVTANEKDGITGKVIALNHNTPRTQESAKDVSISLYKIANYNDEKSFVEKQDLKQNSGSSFDISFQKVSLGSYEIVAEALDNRGNKVTSRFTTYVGKKQTYSQDSKPIFHLTKNKEKYKPGDTAAITLTTDTPLRTILVAKGSASGKLAEKDPFIILSQDQSSTTINTQLNIPNNQVGSLAVFVYAINANTVISDNITIPIDNSSKEIKTTIQFDKKEVKPKEKITATINTVTQENKPISADVSLAVIDDTIFQIVNDNGQEAYPIFYPSYEYSSYLTTYDSTTGIYNINPGGGGGGCFLEGTKIALPGGKSKNIEDIVVGDTILTKASDVSSKLISDTVTKTFRHIVSGYLTINDTLYVTPIHRIFLNNTWQQAKYAKIGDTLLNQDGTIIKITSITKHTGTFVVYNLTTQNTHTFFADGFYVHNEKGGGTDTRDNFVDTAYWNPHIQTDQNGKAEISLTVPDNLTTFSAMAIANTTDSQFGQTTQSFVVKKDVAIIPTLPNLFYQNDKPVISMLLQNSTNETINGTAILAIKDLTIEKVLPINIGSKDFEKVSFAVDLTTPKQNLIFEFSLKDNKNQILDAVSIKKDILPRMEITSSWTSFQGKKDIVFTPPFPNLPFNGMHINISPHVAYGLNNIHFDISGVSASLGKNIYVVSYILAQTENGTINPSLYAYAQIRNNIRSAIQDIIQDRTSVKIQGKEETQWYPSKYASTTETPLLKSLWLIKGLDAALEQNLASEITNLPSIISSAKQTARANSQIIGSLEETIAKEFVLGSSSNNIFQDDPGVLAAKALNGNTEALKRLKEKALLSSNDRFIFTDDNQGFAALALVTKGNANDAEKAIVGISASESNYSYYNSDSLNILAGIKHAISRHIEIEKPKYSIFLNKKNISYEDDCGNCNFSKDFTLNEKEKNFEFTISPETKLPFYTTITTFSYDNPKPIKNDQSLWGFLSTETVPKIASGKIQRSFQSLPSMEKIDQIKSGQPGVVTLSLQKPFNDFIYPTNKDVQSPYSDFSLIDAVSPNHMYIRQVGEARPQFEGAIETKDLTATPSDFSDMHVFFHSYANSSQKNIQLKYTVYGLADGTYYQPKTSIVFPTLGIIVKE